jgi:hypothetical protein
MSLVGLAHTVAVVLATQVDPNQGTAAARRGAVERLQEPNLYDMVFPIIAFGLVILLPTATALWVIYRTVTEKKAETDEV